MKHLARTPLEALFHQLWKDQFSDRQPQMLSCLLEELHVDLSEDKAQKEGLGMGGTRSVPRSPATPSPTSIWLPWPPFSDQFPAFLKKYYQSSPYLHCWNEGEMVVVVVCLNSRPSKRLKSTFYFLKMSLLSKTLLDICLDVRSFGESQSYYRSFHLLLYAV
jgi:hypothetical protein